MNATSGSFMSSERCLKNFWSENLSKDVGICESTTLKWN
jgi:hypothetical protein